MIRLLIVEDQPAVRSGLRMCLGLEPDMTVVGEAGDGPTALAMAAALRPDVVVMDVTLPGMDGIAATAVLRAAVQETRVIACSADDSADVRTRARQAGAAAFVGKHSCGTDLIAAIRAVAGRAAVLPADAADRPKDGVRTAAFD